MKALSGLVVFLLSSFASPQSPLSLRIQHRYDIDASCAGMTLTMKHDTEGRPFLYVASKDAGLKIYNVASTPSLARTIPVSSFNSLHVMNLSQTGRFLFLALGNHFGLAAQNPGFAVIDVADPAKASVLSFWHDPKLKSGAGIVESSGQYAYLGAMRDGLMIFDVSDPKRIVPMSSLKPDMRYPDPNPDASKFNSRGMVVQGDLVYLCYDAGGLRIIDVADRKNPREIGRYSNPALNRKPRAYNNVVVDGALAYVTVDYCGVEVLDVSRPRSISLLSWWNPWNCQTSGLNWFSSLGHTNEIAYDKPNKLIFVSAGKSDLLALDVSNARAPVLRGSYGGPSDELGTWGASIHDDRIYLSYICTAGIPFVSRWSGVKILSYRP